MTIEQEARNEATRRAWDGELSRTDRDGFRARIDASEAFERGYIAGASRPVTDEMVERAISAHRFTNAFGPEEVTRMRAALEAAEEARR